MYKIIQTIISAQKKARASNDYLGIIMNSEALLEYLPELINHSVDMEALYREFEAKLADELDEQGKRRSGAYCETKAKATEHYREWQRSKQMIELVYELVQMGKKIASSVDKEFNAQ